MKRLLNAKFLFITSVIIIAALTRLIEHPLNFTPIMAIGLFGAAYFEDKKFAFLVPLGALFLSDLFIGFYPAFEMITVYGSLALAVVLGIKLLKKVNIYRIVGASLLSSIIFFVVTNFMAWLSPTYNMYPFTMAGLVECYTLAIPFFRNTLAGDLIYSAVLFGSYSLAGLVIPTLAKAKS
jgi:uncharacterized protein DUF6580